MSVVLPVHPLPPDPSGEPQRRGSTTAVPEQIRVCIHVGNYFIDTSLAAHAPLTVVMEGLVPFLSDTLRAEGLTVDFKATGVYSLAVEGGMAFDRTASLSEAGVLDGARLLLHEVHSTEVFKPIIEDGSDALAEFNSVKFAAFTEASARVLGLVATVAGAVLLAALTVAAWWSTPSVAWWLPPTAALTLTAMIGSVVAERRGATAVSYAVGLAATPLAFALGWVAVPAYDGVAGQWTAANVVAATFAVAAVSAAVVWLTGVGITVHTAIVTTTGTAAAAAAAATFTGFGARQIGTVAVVVGMIVVAAAPALSLALARVRPPSLPVPGEDIDRHELDEAAMVVEVFDDGNDVRTVALSDDEDTQLERRSRVANKYLTGLFAAAAAIVVTGAVAAVEPDTYYAPGEVAVAIIAALVLVLRGRSLTDRVHAVLFFTGGFALLAGMSATVVAGTADPVVGLAVIGAIAAVVVLATLAGLMLPGTKLSPITLRRIEQLEFVLILSIAPLAFWIIGAYAALRNFR